MTSDLARQSSPEFREIELPWGAWCEDTTHRIGLPAAWQIDILSPRDAPAWTAERIESALDSPIGSPPLAELSRGCQTACVVVDDLARPTRASDVLPKLLDQIHQGGIDRERVTIVVSTGTHGALDERQVAWKVGRQVASSYRVEVHDAKSSVVSSGIQYGSRELLINRTFLEADLKVAVGSVLPHSFAGYSGGAKMMLPGLADVEATVRSHKFVQMGLRGGSDPNENRFRLEIEDLARQMGLGYVVCVISNQRRETAGVFAGDLTQAHRQACRRAAEVYATELVDSYDCLVLNAYPKDIDLVQADNVMVALKTARSAVVHDEGILLITTAASEGIGTHGLFAPGGASYVPPRPRRALGGRQLWLYSPNVSEADARKLYWQEYPFFQDRMALGRALAERLPGRARAAVLPCAPMQQLDDRRPARPDETP